MSEHDQARQHQVDEDAADLARFGYKQQLHRTMGSYTSFALAFSMITITTTIFTLFAQPFQTVGGVGIWLWIPATVGVVLIGLIYAHLSARLPVTGYAYQWSSRLVSAHLGWFTGWNAMLATVIGTAGIAVAFASVFAPDFWANPTHHDIELLAAGAIVVGVLLNIVSIRVASRVNNVGASVELFGTVGLSIVLGIGLLFFRHHQGLGILTSAHPTLPGKVTLTTLGIALLLPVYTLAGWEGSADLAEETKDPRAVAPRAMLRSIIISGIAAFFVYAVFALAMGPDVRSIINSTNENPLVAIFASRFGTAMGDLLQVVAFVAIFSALIANVAVATRTVFALARDGMIPASHLWQRVNSRTGTPIPAIIGVGVVALVVNLLSAGIVARVTAIVSVVVYVTYGSSIVAALMGKRRASIPDAPQRYFTLGRWFTPVAWAALVWCLIVIGYMTLPVVNRVGGEYTLYAEIIGLAWYALWLRARLVRGEAGPRVLAVAGGDDSAADPRHGA